MPQPWYASRIPGTLHWWRHCNREAWANWRRLHSKKASCTYHSCDLRPERFSSSKFSAALLFHSKVMAKGAPYTSSSSSPHQTSHCKGPVHQAPKNCTRLLWRRTGCVGSFTRNSTASAESLHLRTGGNGLVDKTFVPTAEGDTFFAGGLTFLAGLRSSSCEPQMSA